MKNKGAVFGYYGRDNFGDDLFCYVLQHVARTTDGIHLSFVGASIKKELHNSFRAKILQKYISKNGIRGSLLRVILYISAVLKADFIVFGGGSLFGENASFKFSQTITLLSNILNRNIFAVGVSVGPFSTEARENRFIKQLSHFQYIAVRDFSSMKYLQAAGLTRISDYIGDIAYSLPAIYLPKTKQKKNTLVIAIHLTEYITIIEELVKVIKYDETLNSVILLSLDTNSISLNKSLFNKLEKLGVPVSMYDYGESIEDVIDILSSAKMVITSKLHGAITGFVYNVSVFLFCYQEKCIHFLRENGLPGIFHKYPNCTESVELILEILSDSKKIQKYESVNEKYESLRSSLIRFTK